MLRKLEKYELLEEIGHGGMATVFKARDERLDRMVAVKVLHPHLQKAPEARVRFTREARSVAKLAHKNILEIYDYSGEDSPESYIAAELLTGPTLKRYGEEHPELPPEIAACFAIQIAEALAAAHESGIIHRDVKPENVLLHENSFVKLTDFGIAQMVESQSFTATGQILGSPGHMAPEQVAGKGIGPRTDVFSLGTVLYYLAVGRLPFTGRNPHHVLKRIVDAEYSDPLRVRADVGKELRDIIVKAMAREPEERFATAQEMADALRAFVAKLGDEKPGVLLRRYLADPEAVGAELRERVVDLYTKRGREAVARKDRNAALAAFNRVLALDESNEEVLKLVERLGSESSKSLWFGIAAVLGGAIALTAALWPDAPTDPGEKDPLQPEVLADAAIDVPIADAQLDAGFADAEPEDGRATMRPVAARTRRVRIVPTPRSVSISVDRGPAQPWGPGGIEFLELDVGPHELVFDGECCVRTPRTFRVRPGHDVYTIEQRLLWKPARVIVRCPTCPADTRVQVDRRGISPGVTSRANEILSVPLGDSEELRQIRVTAQGHVSYNETVTLRSQQSTEINVRLRPEGEEEGSQ